MRHKIKRLLTEEEKKNYGMITYQPTKADIEILLKFQELIQKDKREN